VEPTHAACMRVKWVSMKDSALSSDWRKSAKLAAVLLLVAFVTLLVAFAALTYLGILPGINHL